MAKRKPVPTVEEHLKIGGMLYKVPCDLCDMAQIIWQSYPKAYPIVKALGKLTNQISYLRNRLDDAELSKYSEEEISVAAYIRPYPRETQEDTLPWHRPSEAVKLLGVTNE